jgi:hypothetical protein
VIDYEHDSTGRIVHGQGVYTVTLAGQLSEATGDLNLYKIASNYLEEVPLLSGGVGDTGDMAQAEVVGDSFSYAWAPPNQPAHFPADQNDMLSINVTGAFNEIDTAAIGYSPILPAFKPSLKVILTSQEANAGLRFGGYYNLAERQNFWSDNVGITPLISKASTKTAF